MLSQQTKSDLQGEIIQLQAEKSGLLNELSVIRTDIREANAASADVFKQVKKAENTLTELKKQALKESESAKKQAELEQVKIQTIKDEASELMVDNAKLRQEKNALIIEKIELNNDIALHKEDIERITDEKNSLYKLQKDLIDQMRDLQNSIDGLKKTHDELVVENEQLKISLTDKESKFLILLNKEADLKIYEERIRLAYAEAFPGLIINV